MLLTPKQLAKEIRVAVTTFWVSLLLEIRSWLRVSRSQPRFSVAACLPIGFVLAKVLDLNSPAGIITLTTILSLSLEAARKTFEKVTERLSRKGRKASKRTEPKRKAKANLKIRSGH